jgi:hypothetical protein
MRSLASSSGARARVLRGVCLGQRRLREGLGLVVPPRLPSQAPAPHEREGRVRRVLVGGERLSRGVERGKRGVDLPIEDVNLGAEHA